MTLHIIEQCPDWNQVSMARRFGVSRAAVQWVLKGQSWAGLGEGA